VALTFRLNRRLQVCRQPRERLIKQDITYGRETSAITAVNAVDDADFPDDFLYVSDYVETTVVPVNRIVTSIKVHTVLISALEFNVNRE